MRPRLLVPLAILTTLAAAFTAFTWFASADWPVTPRTAIALGDGSAGVVWCDVPLGKTATPPVPMLEFNFEPHRLCWMPTYLNIVHPAPTPATFSALFIPTYIPLLLLALPTTLLYLRARRASRPGLCPHCSYPLTGLAPNSPCPECGKLSGAPSA